MTSSPSSAMTMMSSYVRLVLYGWAKSTVVGALLNLLPHSLKVNLRVLLINGKTHDFPFDPSTTGSQIALHVFHNWPSGMSVQVHQLTIPHCHGISMMTLLISVVAQRQLCFLAIDAE